MPHPDRASRHVDWLRSLGFTSRDFERMKELAERRARQHEGVEALEDLDAPFRVGAVLASERTRYSGDLIGTWSGCALLSWPRPTRAPPKRLDPRWEWMGSLADMKRHGAQVTLSCTKAGCGQYWRIDLDGWIADFGPDFDVVDYHPPCPVCRGLTLVHVAPAPGTPSRPMINRPTLKR